MSKERPGHKHVICTNSQPPLGSHWLCRGRILLLGPLSHHLRLTRLAQGFRVEARWLRKKTWLWTWLEELSGKGWGGWRLPKARQLRVAGHGREAFPPDVTQGFLGMELPAFLALTPLEIPENRQPAGPCSVGLHRHFEHSS